jgi:hypothetical protein
LVQDETIAPTPISRRNISARYENIRPQNVPDIFVDVSVETVIASASTSHITRLSGIVPKPARRGTTYTAPLWLGTFLALLLLALVCGTALWFVHQLNIVQHTRRRRQFALGFYTAHRDSLRGNYIRSPENQRSFTTINDSWAVNLSTLIVRFALQRHEDKEMNCPHSQRIVHILNTSPYAARRYIYPMLTRIQAKILRDVKCTDNVTRTPKKPMQFAHETRKANRATTPQIPSTALAATHMQPTKKPAYLRLVPPLTSEQG